MINAKTKMSTKRFIYKKDILIFEQFKCSPKQEHPEPTACGKETNGEKK